MTNFCKRKYIVKRNWGEGKTDNINQENRFGPNNDSLHIFEWRKVISYKFVDY